MGEEDDPGTATVANRTPEEALSLLGNETRLRTLRALAETPGETVPFSALRERVGERDSGKFNYHLGKLVGHFVRRTEEGYELTMAGRRIVGALFAGTYTDEPAFDPIELDAPCPECGGTLTAEYGDEHVRVRCDCCGEWDNRFTFPPGTVAQFDRDELPAAFDRWLRTMAERIVSGFCTNCAGRVSARLVADCDHPDGIHARYACERCGDLAQFSLGVVVRFHPAAIAFLHDHGIDATAAPTWEISGRVEETVEALPRDPPRGRVVLAVGGERLVAEVDRDAAVADVERGPVDDAG